MNSQQLLREIHSSLEDEQFYPTLYDLIAEQTQNRASDSIIQREYVSLSKELLATKIQSAAAVRNILKSRALAKYLIDSDGSLVEARVDLVIAELESALHSLGPSRQHESARNDHMLKVLKYIKSDKALRNRLLALTKPFNNQRMDEIIRDTLQLPAHQKITDAEARRAALSAWLSYLRQNVGSCFATAPAIIVHTEQPHVFLQDINDLYASSQLKRTFSGKEFSVPLSLSWGAGDLRRRFLIARNIDESITLPFWRSPGFHAALSSLGLLEESLRSGEKSRLARELFQKLLLNWEGDAPYLETCAEEIIQRVVMHKSGITTKALLEFKNRPKQMIPGTVAATPLGGGKGGSMIKYEQEVKTALSAFKSLTDNSLLKVWEFTVASFAETKANFAKWNLYTSLGLDANQPGGIGECLYQAISQKVEQSNQKVREYNEEYEQIYTQLKYMEMRIQRASTEQELKHLKAEYTSMRNEFRSFEEIRNREHKKAQRYANLFSELIDIYISLFPDYFQEVYDADLHEVDVGPYDDSPAGFRLLYKHGRANPSAWTLVKTPEEYADALSSFFSMTETRISSHEHFEGMQHEIGTIVTSIVSHVKSNFFLEAALLRMCRAHGQPLIKDPLKHLEQIPTKPWAYTSGGSMGSLVSSYFKRDEEPTEKSRWVENPIELLTFLVDCAKIIPGKAFEEYLNNGEKSLLIHSPTHAFLFRPGCLPFREAVLSDAYTYIWVRDHLQNPAAEFVEMLFLEPDTMHFILDELAKEIPDQIRYYFNSVFKDLPGKMRSYEFRDYILNEIGKYRQFNTQGMPTLNADKIDAVLYKMLPLTRPYQIRGRIQSVLQTLPGMNSEAVEKILDLYEKAAGREGIRTPLGAHQLKNVILSLLLLHYRKSSTRINYHLAVAQAMQKLGYAMPRPIFFADSNWVTDYFGFVVNPGNGKLDLWRLDVTGIEGAPMSHWRKWLDGSQKKPDWGVYVNPYEYRL